MGWMRTKRAMNGLDILFITSELTLLLPSSSCKSIQQQKYHHKLIFVFEKVSQSTHAQISPLADFLFKELRRPCQQRPSNTDTYLLWEEGWGMRVIRNFECWKGDDLTITGSGIPALWFASRTRRSSEVFVRMDAGWKATDSNMNQVTRDRDVGSDWRGTGEELPMERPRLQKHILHFLRL